jgi:hypothetical protein
VTSSYGPRVDAETGELHARVSQAHDYSRVTILWRRRVGNGTIDCELLRSPTPAQRLVQLRAQYTDAGEPVLHIIKCSDELDEARQAARLQRLILLASARPTSAAQSTE